MLAQLGTESAPAGGSFQDTGPDLTPSLAAVGGPFRRSHPPESPGERLPGVAAPGLPAGAAAPLPLRPDLPPRRVSQRARLPPHLPAPPGGRPPDHLPPDAAPRERPAAPAALRLSRNPPVGEGPPGGGG